MNSEKNYYEILGISRDASQDEIKEAYREKAFELHPDRNEGTEEAFRQVSEAYDVLGDEESRQRYDQFGSQAATMGGVASSREGFSSADREEVYSIFEEIFDEQFRDRPDDDHSVVFDVDVSFEEAFHGASKEVDLELDHRCSNCGGTGSESGTGRRICPRCYGEGSSISESNSFGVSVSSLCSRCKGEGSILEDPCHACGGDGMTVTERSIEVDVPPGVETGQKLRISDAQFDDEFFLRVRVRPSDAFDRRGSDLYLDRSIPMTTAALGGEIEIDELPGDDRLVLSVPSGTQPGDRLRLEDRGMAQIGSDQRGDLIVRMDVNVPTDLSDEEQSALESFRQARQS